MMHRNRKALLSTVLALLLVLLLIRTSHRAYHHTPLLNLSHQPHGTDLFTLTLTKGRTKYAALTARMCPDPQFQPPSDTTDAEKVFHSGHYQAIYLGPPEQPFTNRFGGDANWQRFATHLPLPDSQPIPTTEEYLDVGIRPSPYDPAAEDYQFAIRNTGEPSGILIARSLNKGRNPGLAASDALFYAYREYASKLIGPGYPDYRTITNLKYAMHDRVVKEETAEVLQMLYLRHNAALKERGEAQLLVGEFARWSPSSDPESDNHSPSDPPSPSSPSTFTDDNESDTSEHTLFLLLLGTPELASFVSMLANHFDELGHKCVLSVAAESIDGGWYLGVVVGTEFGGECLDRDVPDVVRGDRMIKAEQARREEEERMMGEGEGKKEKGDHDGEGKEVVQKEAKYSAEWAGKMTTAPSEAEDSEPAAEDVQNEAVMVAPAPVAGNEQEPSPDTPHNQKTMTDQKALANLPQHTITENDKSDAGIATPPVEEEEAKENATPPL